MSGKTLQVALIGDRKGDYLPHISAESIVPEIASMLEIKAEAVWIPTEEVDHADMGQFQAIWAGSGPYLSPEGTMEAIRFARENKIPFIGTCSGFKYTIIELAKNVCHAQDPEAYISLNESCGTEYKELTISLHPSTVKEWYAATEAKETSHCRFEINSTYQKQINQHFTFAGTADDGRMVIAELTDHPFFLATLFLPQLNKQSKLLKTLIQSATQTV
ncbi:MAG: hypothetical protein AAF519_18810 [Bacteroidota bacterium]